MTKHLVRIISLCMIMAALCLLPLYAHAADQKMSLQWQKGKRTVEIGKKLSLKVIIRHKKRGSKLVWSSSSKKIATVSKGGMVFGKKAGKVKISVKIQGTFIKRGCQIRVVKPKKTQKSSDHKTPRPKKTLVPGSKPEETGLPMVSPSVESTKYPLIPTIEPADPSGSPLIPTMEPADPTGNPLIPTMEPPDPSGSPLIPTMEPPDPTENPFLPTKEPVRPTDVPTAPPVSPTPIYVPEDTELIPYSAVMEIQGEIMTVYLVHKNYDGQVHMRLNGKEFTAGGNAKDALMLLAYGGTTKTDSAGRIRISRLTDETDQLEPYWTVEDLVEGVSYQMRAETKNTLYPNYANCGVIYFRGDVTAAIEIY